MLSAGKDGHGHVRVRSPALRVSRDSGRSSAGLSSPVSSCWFAGIEEETSQPQQPQRPDATATREAVTLPSMATGVFSITATVASSCRGFGGNLLTATLLAVAGVAAPVASVLGGHSQRPGPGPCPPSPCKDFLSS